MDEYLKAALAGATFGAVAFDDPDDAMAKLAAVGIDLSKMAEGALGYLRLAPTARPEDVYIWAARRKLHDLPEGGFGGIDDAIVRFFRLVTACGKGLLAEFEPRQPKIVAPMSFSGAPGDDIFERTHAEPPPPLDEPVPPVVRGPGALGAGIPNMADFNEMTPADTQAFLGRAAAPTRRIGPESFINDPTLGPATARAPAASRRRGTTKRTTS
ncbi:MAG: hypothetical protein KGQ37_03705 [Hyphomicrobiales bacterium]|nr:hypothetical protein [Hyphomicrobiales bacterium]